jgi:phosphatidylserine decarboxylase
MLQAKGRLYRVDDLLATDSEHVSSFHHGSFMTLYLSPKDYHRVHMPMDAVLKEVVYVPGALFSVQPATTRMIPRLFARNERLVVFFETRAGRMAMVLVGATIVGAIGTSWQGEILRQKSLKKWVYDEHQTDINTLFKQADEMGYFKLGSTVILLFEDTATLQWITSLQAGSSIKMGQKIASLP